MTGALKTPLARTLSRYIRSEIRDALDRLGRALPCTVTAVNGAFVTVSFQVSGTVLPTIQVPSGISQYVRLPIQVGDMGVCFPAQLPLDSVDGAGTTTPPPDVSSMNLTGLVFFPIGNKNWSAVNAQQVVITGPQGVQLSDKSQSVTVNITNGQITLTANTSISFTAGGKTLTINSTGITLDGILWETHVHGGVTTGSGVTGPPA